mmetsp:Transcript_30371/g.68477  ORF Transcript_30371/g.68477 Transcript_30371/m.68477 type:complete len:115 (-) Transcript_30371:649-993(-)
MINALSPTLSLQKRNIQLDCVHSRRSYISSSSLTDSGDHTLHLLSIKCIAGHHLQQYSTHDVSAHCPSTDRLEVFVGCSWVRDRVVIEWKGVENSTHLRSKVEKMHVAQRSARV